MFLRIIVISIFIFSIFINKCIPQTYRSQQTQILAYNIFLNGLIGGIGGAINKEKNEKGYLAFGKNFLKGGLGGIIKYTAKYETYYLRDENKSYLAKPNRLFYYLGYSFVHNASLNKKLWHSYHCQFYGINLELNFEKKFYVKSRISLFTIGSVAYFFIIDNKLNLHKSLEYGLFYFDMNPKNSVDGITGTAIHNTLAMLDGKKNNPKWLFSHEFIHTYQFPDYFPVSNFFNKSFRSTNGIESSNEIESTKKIKLINKINSTKSYNFLSKYFFLDIPYMSLSYLLQPKPLYFKNFYEFEAEHFATRSFVDR